MVTIFIDNQPYEVKPDQNLLDAAVSNGLNLPYFCWHPALGSAGACRQCAVQHFKDENDTQGRMVMSCMTPVTEGARFSIEHPTCKSFRADISEWMMINHPHDCAVCDEGGECHLQDMTQMTGHNQRRYRFKKRTHLNQDLGPHINHEMNRCITCYRCVRYYRDIAGAEDLHAFSSGNRVYFGRMESGTLESEFSGNLVEICPTGVFTDKHFKAQHTRKWDLQTAPSVCQQCSLGCNISPGERLGILRRVQNRFHPEINGYFLCDKGRFGHQFVNDSHRVPVQSPTPPLSQDSNCMGIGSPRASLEANYALWKMVGAENFYSSETDDVFDLSSRMIEILSQHPSTASLEDVRCADLILVLGEDVTQTAPMLALAIRQNFYHQWQSKAASQGIPPWNDLAIRNAEHELAPLLYLALETPSKIDSLAYQHIGIDPEAIRNWIPVLLAAQNPVIIAGASLGPASLIETAFELCKLAPHSKLSFVWPGVNSAGLALLHPKRLSQAPLDRPALILEADLKPAQRQRLSTFTVIDFLESETTESAHQKLGCASFAEATGSFVNNELRAQRSYAVFQRRHPRPESWRIVRDLAALTWQNIDELSQDLRKDFPVFEAFYQTLHPALFRMNHQKIARQSLEWSGRTSINADLSVHEKAPSPDPDSPLSYSMEGYHGNTPSDLASYYWKPGWNSVSALNSLSHATRGVKLKPLC
ncbi:MAG: NADH-quinone oxidoreductase subunit G [Myxococcaceae bacterium]|nr:NADH-quinone oxidoreductase subunit G [Myxococcaceae bacterium]MBH2006440.1 NADH-quinone oxidoreductase subunit G [Myxococcaceae bacterium]